jgi:hypothetical protein
MDVSCMTTHQIMYYPVGVPLSVCKCGSQCLSHSGSLLYTSRLINWTLGKGVCIYTFLGGILSISEAWAASLSLGGPGGILGWFSVSSGAGCMSLSDGGAWMLLRLWHVWGYCAVPCWQGWQLSIWLYWSIASCLTIAAFIFLCS